ncbi:MFS transporter [Bacillus sp. NEB1478]|uniref:MFS transporter n=1 Tax=Bacillus sp. NEB1478 TaxID=3073816 RepID=UPI002873813C|nr:MFS transporter [Bacillus sp. NEB1478]WNB91265.1 hypothetical protein RGB74_15340 [Bacillus sp. NEB1478]
MKKIHYGWVMVAITFCILIVGAGIRSMPSVLMVPLENDFGWNRSVVSLSLAINFFYGLDWVATVPPTIKLTSDIFGKERAGILFGWIMAAHQIGAAIAAFSGGLLHDMLGSYYFSFISAGAFCVMASLIVMKIGRTSKPHLNESSLQV